MPMLWLIVLRPIVLRLVVLRLVIAGFALLAVPLGQAHSPRPVPACEAPIRPPDKKAVERWNQYVDALGGYRSCLNGFIEANHAAADHHRAAANDATRQWNNYVRDNLNVPEDFPHESQIRSGIR